MIKKNDIVELTCSRLGSNMEGICFYDGFTIFVPGLLPDETGTVHIVKVQNTIAYGILSSQLTSSADRIEPECTSYPKCGGCTCRHMSYKTTLESKRQQVQYCFHSIGHIDIDIPPIIGMEEPFHYRNKSSFPVGGTSENPVLGFFAPRSHRIIPVSSCINAMLPTDEICRLFLSWMKQHHLEPYHEDSHTGLIRHLVLRINQKHEFMVTIVSKEKDVPYLNDLVEQLKPLGLISLVVNVNHQASNVILGNKYYTVFGPGTIHDQLLNLDFELSPASFFQVNVVQAEKIYQLALDFASLSPDSNVFDVYCGTGTISLSLASHCKHVIGIEIVPQAIDNARENAIRNHFQNTEFIVGKAEDCLPELIANHERADVILVDPPRKGLDPVVIQSICSTKPDRLVYVSCNPATLARDAMMIVEKGFYLKKIQCVDMFCWTSDVESVALFERSDS